jgi:replicative DNA helicase
VIRESELLPVIRQFLTDPAMFYRTENQILFRVLCDLADAGKGIDGLLVHSELKSRQLLEDAGGIDYLKAIINSVPTTSHAEWYAAIVKEKSALRSVITLCAKISDTAFNCDGQVYDVVADLQTGAAKIAEQGIINAGAFAGEYLPGVLADIHGTDANETGGLPTGLRDVDAIIRGLKKKHLVVIAGHGKHGKTSLGMGIVATVGLVCMEPVCVISFEMTAEELTKRLLLSTCEISEHDLRHGRGTPPQQQQYGYAKEAIQNCRILLDDDCAPTLAGVRNRLHIYKRRYGISLAMIDYYQLMEGTDARARRYDHLVEISRGLKKLAGELDIPIVVLAQLNAEAEKEDRLPRMNDIEECKRISKDANVVMLLDREYMRKRNDPNWMLQNQHNLDRATLDIAGLRGGAAGMVELRYHAAITKFS